MHKLPITAAKNHWGRRLDKFYFSILATFYRGTSLLLRTPQRFLAANVSVKAILTVLMMRKHLTKRKKEKDNYPAPRGFNFLAPRFAPFGTHWD